MINAHSFEKVEIGRLSKMSPNERDQLPFGVIGIDRNEFAVIYNTTEARAAGLKPESVIGAPFFEAVAQCMNNFMVAERFRDEPELDHIVPYVLTLRMRPTPVRLRLLAAPDVDLRYILVER